MSVKTIPSLRSCVSFFFSQLYEAVLLYDYCMDSVFTELVSIQLAFLLL